LSRGNDGSGLLTAEHCGGDLLGIGEVGHARLDDLHAGPLQPVLDLDLELRRDLRVWLESATSPSLWASYG